MKIYRCLYILGIEPFVRRTSFLEVLGQTEISLNGEEMLPSNSSLELFSNNVSNQAQICPQYVIWNQEVQYELKHFSDFQITNYENNPFYFFENHIYFLAQYSI